MVLPTGATVTYQHASTLPTDLRLSKYISSVTTDPIGGGAQTTSYSYQFNTSDYTVLKTTVTRADGSKHIVDFNPSGSSSPNLRQSQTWTDIDGTTALRQVDTVWVSGAMGTQISVETVSKPGTDWQVKTERTVDQWGREVARRVYDRQVLHLYNTVYKWVLNSAVHRQFATPSPITYVGELLQEDQAVQSLDYGTGNDERVVSTTRYRYDEYPLLDRGAVVGQASGHGPSNQSRGNLTTVSRELFTEGRSVERHVLYDTVGNVVEVEDELGRSTATDYSLTFHYAYPTSATNALGHTGTVGYSFNTGLPVSSTDPNGQATAFQYDAYDRISREDYPDGGWRTYAYTDVYSGGSGGKFRSYIDITTSVDASQTRRLYKYFDGLGRLLRTSAVEPTGTFINVDREYAACSCMGKTEKVSLPYRNNGETVRWTEKRYDGIGRVTLVIPPDGTAFSNRVDPRYNAATGVYDNTPVRLSNWSWTEIFQGAQTRTSKADSLGRTISETHPEAGATIFDYADNALLLSKTDARGVSTTVSYDVLNRPSTVVYSDSTPSAMYDYDQGAYGIGRIHSASNANSIDVIDGILDAFNEAREAVLSDPSKIPSKYRGCVVGAFETGKIRKGFRKQKIKFKFTGASEYVAKVFPRVITGVPLIGGSTISIGQSAADSGSIVGESYSHPGWTSPAANTALHEALHLCGSKNEVDTDGISDQYFPPVPPQGQ